MSKKIFALAVLLLPLFMFGCDKEKIVESTEYIEKVEYVELPPDTIFVRDTLIDYDSVTVYSTDTVTVRDTIRTTIHDTVLQYITIYDTTLAYDTVVVIQQFTDTVTIGSTDTVFVNHTDTVRITNTVTVIDTVLMAQCTPNQGLAFSALTYQSNSVVIDFINTEYGINEGFIFYLNEFQSDITRVSANVYDIYGLIDFWTTDFAGFEALEYYWRLTFIGGDPSDPTRWQMSEPPGQLAGRQPGIHVVNKTASPERIAR